MTTRNTTHRIRAVAATVALFLAVVGCGPMDEGGGGGDNDDGTTGSSIDDIRSSRDRISNPSVPKSKLQTLTKHNADFAFDLYGELAAEKSGENFFYSPHSISSALAMTYAGAEGSSESQMRSALQFNLPEKDLHPAFNQLDLTLEKRADQTGNNKTGSPFKLEIANSIWGQKNYAFEQPFLDTLAKHYGAGLRGLDFQEKPDQSRKTINDWVEQKTENTIKDLLPKGAVTPLTRMVLTNAIYFKASWEHKFDKSNTRKAQFTTAAGNPVQADMMSLKQQNGLSYAEGGNWKAVELPYVGEKVSMVVIVPDKGKFGAVEQNVSGSWLQSVFGKLHGQAVKLKLPKFDVTSKFSVKKMLQALGMEAPFDENAADFTDIADKEQLFIDDVIHQSFVSVDEKGTEAAAATAVSVGTTSAPKFENVSVDRPFLFMIRDRETNAVVFAGRVVDPS